MLVCVCDGGKFSVDWANNVHSKETASGGNGNGVSLFTTTTITTIATAALPRCYADDRAHTPNAECIIIIIIVVAVVGC